MPFGRRSPSRRMRLGSRGMEHRRTGWLTKRCPQGSSRGREGRGPIGPGQRSQRRGPDHPHPKTTDPGAGRAASPQPEDRGGEGEDGRAQPASTEAATGGPAVGARGMAAPHDGEEGGVEPTNGGVESPELSSPTRPSITWCAVEKTAARSSGPPRPAPRFSAMQDALQAEHLLERLHLPLFRRQIRQYSTARLLDGAYVLVLQTANEILGIRDYIIHSTDSNVRSLDRAAKYRDRCREIAGESKKKLEEAKSRHAAMETERDDWRSCCRDAEYKAAVEVDRINAAKIKLVVLKKALESVQVEIKELTEKLQATEGQADTAGSQARAAEEKATEANKRAQEAEERAGKADELNKEAGERDAKAEEEVREADAARLIATARLWDAEA